MEGIPKPRLNEKLDPGIMREPSFGSLALDLQSKTVRSSETGLGERLSDQQYQILWLLVRAQGALLSQSEIEGFLYEDWPDEKDLPTGNTLEVLLSTLRNTLDRLTNGKISIENVRNLGWRIITKND